MDLHQYVPGSMAGWMSLALLGRKREADLHLEINDRSGSTTRHQQPNTRMFFLFFSVFSLLTLGGIFNDLHGLSQRCSFWGISGMVMFDLSLWFTIGDNLYFWIMTRIIRPMYWPETTVGNWKSCDSRGPTFVVYSCRGYFSLINMTIFAGIKQTMQSYGNFEGFSF